MLVVTRNLRSYVVVAVAIIAAVIYCAGNASASEADWFGAGNAVATHSRDYGTIQRAQNFDCVPRKLANVSTDVCLMGSTIGPITTDGRIVVDGNAYLLTDGNLHGYITSIPNSKRFIQTNFVSTGAYLHVYDQLYRQDIDRKLYWGLPLSTRYVINKPWDRGLTDSSGAMLKVNGPPLASSSNGEWMLVDVPYVGLFRVNSDMTELVPFGLSMEQLKAKNQPIYNFAISNDGKHVAAVGPQTLSIYQLDGCAQHGYVTGTAPSFEGCKSKNIWSDVVAGSAKLTGLPNLEIAGTVRFMDDFNVSLDVRYRDSRSQPFSYQRYNVTAPGAELHKLGLLGMGDSYISGEGIGEYYEGTDTNDNKCHLAYASYPYLIGGGMFDSYKSVACAGAKTMDVNGRSRDYTGQTRNKIKLSERTPDSVSILALFSPGYAQQLNFVDTYRPKTALLSIGGNDVEFSNIVKSCVAGDTCFADYASRRQKAEQIAGIFDSLKETYEGILNSGTQYLYVVGYPEIAKTGGDCGLNVHLNGGEIAFANELVGYLNQTIEAAASAAGARYVDISRALDGHRLCETVDGDIAMNGLTAGDDKGIFIPFTNVTLGPIANESYHPNELGHVLIAKTILNKTDNLSQPMPVPDSTAQAPPINDDMPLLAGMGDPVPFSKLETVSDLVDGTVYQDTPTTIKVDGLEANTLPNSEYEVVLHSTPVSLGKVTSDANGDINAIVKIPADMPVGFHTINLYGKDYGDEDIQIQKTIFVAHTPDDLDGDGVPNADEPCLIFASSGRDVDEDGVDDACDAVIGLAPIHPADKVGGDSSLPSSPDVATSAISGNPQGVVAARSQSPYSVDSAINQQPAAAGVVQGAATSLADETATIKSKNKTPTVTTVETWWPAAILLSSATLLGVWIVARHGRHSA